MTSGEAISKLNRMADALWKLPRADVLSCTVSDTMGRIQIHLYVHSLEEFQDMTDSENFVLDDEINDNGEGKPWRFVHTMVNGVEFLAIIDAAPGEATPETAQKEDNHTASIAEAGAEVKEDCCETL